MNKSTFHLMKVPVISIGSSVPRDHFDATIHSVFDSSINLHLAPQGGLLTILISDHDDLPQGIRLDVRKLPLWSLPVGLRAVCRNGILRFDASPLSIDLRGARSWDGRLPPVAIDMQKPSTERAWSIVWQTLNKQQRLKQTDLVANDLFQQDEGSLLTRKLSLPVQELIAATERLDPHTSTMAARKMIGLGPGVTPSGDDILIGYLAGLRGAAAQDDRRLAFLSTFGESLSKCTKDINEISRTYLHHAIKGEFSSSIIRLASAISGGEQQRLMSAAKGAMRAGHSSGMDAVTGLLIGLAVWGKSSYP
ncbi:MAG TPA: DUF2877 domain-containing protein [Anaerolineales bacterium]